MKKLLLLLCLFLISASPEIPLTPGKNARDVKIQRQFDEFEARVRKHLKNKKITTKVITAATVAASSGTFTNTVTAKEVVTAYGFFHDRGDPSAFDYVFGDLTRDSTWRDLDLSGIVPVGAKTVALIVGIVTPTVGHVVGFRKNGNVNGFNSSELRGQVSNVFLVQDIIVALDSNRVIEYNANVSFTTINIVVKGWFK